MNLLHVHDLLIIGAGLGGVLGLKYARDTGVDALLLEKQAVIGGLWATLPPWQDIQYNRCDWTLGDIPIAGEDQASIRANIQAFADRFDLGQQIRLNVEVTNARFDGALWVLSTTRGEYRSKYLLASTGIHNRPYVPPVSRANSAVLEYHSATLMNPHELAGKLVLVVGGGASAYDLLDLCFEHGAASIRWAYRSLRWMSPTLRPKYSAGGPRELARQQMNGVSVSQLNQHTNTTLRARYLKLGIDAIIPERNFDFNIDQLIPGRYRMTEGFSKIERHKGEVLAIEGRSVKMSSGEALDVDTLLWGTGYEVDTRYFDLPALANIRTRADLARRCGSMFLSLDQPRLFFLAPNLLEGTGSAPLAYAQVCRSIMAHIQGKAHFDETVVGRNRNHFDLMAFLASRDPFNYPSETWHHELRKLAFDHPDGVPLPIPQARAF